MTKLTITAKGQVRLQQTVLLLISLAASRSAIVESSRLRK
jgi:hypothetical protein